MHADSSTILQRLGPGPVRGVDMSHVFLLRLDLLGGRAPGNKAFKLRRNLERARAMGLHRVLSFGGAWSNHLHALAAVAAELGMESTGIVRGGEVETPTLADARAWGMQLVPVTRETYRRRHDPAWLAELEQRYGPCLVIPEGGANPEGVRGCLEIAKLINSTGRQFSRAVVAVGTGTTLAGLAAGLQSVDEVVGISALKGAQDLEQRVQSSLDHSGLAAQVPWRILHDYHCGGFARASAPLREFMPAFEETHGVPLEPVYTGKMLYAIHSHLSRGEWSVNDPILAIHTGGLQGRRGYSWLG